MVAKITSQNQITIPAEVRDRAGLQSGDEVIFIPDYDDPEKFVMFKKKDIAGLGGSLAKYAKNKPKALDMQRIREEMYTFRYKRYLKQE